MQNTELKFLPFVMSGVTNTGVAGYIGNINVRKFPAQSLTIDIFGNTFYRNYEFGASDDVGVYWNKEKSPYQNKEHLLYMATVIQKSLQGRFDYGKKLRASQTYDFTVYLPTDSHNEPDYAFMERFIYAVQKLVIKDVVVWTDKKMKAYRKIVGRETDTNNA